MESDRDPLSQISQIDIDDLDGMDAAAFPKKKGTQYVIRKFETYIKKRQINVDLSQATAEELPP